jgi:hypothetical protein
VEPEPNAQFSRLVQIRGGLKYQYRRLRDGWWGRDLSVLRRLERRGKVIRGIGTYGVPTVYAFAFDDTRLIIGNYSAVGGTHLLGGQHAIKHVASYPLRFNLGLDGAGQDGNPPPSRGDIVIGSDAWVTYGTYVLGGVTIGDGAVVATGAVVSKDVPPYAIVAGNPAKVIKYRFSPEQIEALLEIRWWDWPQEEIIEATPYLSNEDVDGFIAYAREKQQRSTAQPSS